MCEGHFPELSGFLELLEVLFARVADRSSSSHSLIRKCHFNDGDGGGGATDRNEEEDEDETRAAAADEAAVLPCWLVPALQTHP